MNKSFYFLKKGFDRASRSGKFLKENKSMTPVLGISIASCGKKMLWVSEDFSFRELIIDKLHNAS